MDEGSPEALARARLLVAAEGLGFPAAGLPVLARYVAAVLDEGERVNLTGAKTLDAALDVLALDSLPVVSAWSKARTPVRSRCRP